VFRRKKPDLPVLRSPFVPCWAHIGQNARRAGQKKCTLGPPFPPKLPRTARNGQARKGADAPKEHSSFFDEVGAKTRAQSAPRLAAKKARPRENGHAPKRWRRKDAKSTGDEKDKTHTSTPIFSRRRDLARSAKLLWPHTEGHWFDSQKNISQKKHFKKKKKFGESWTFTSFTQNAT
jgi:hypothetical protein